MVVIQNLKFVGGTKTLVVIEYSGVFVLLKKAFLWRNMWTFFLGLPKMDVIASWWSEQGSTWP